MTIKQNMITLPKTTITSAPSRFLGARGDLAIAAFAMVLILAQGACGSDDTDTAADATVATPVDASTQDTWTSFASGFFEAYCSECHGPGDALRDYSLLPMVESEAAKIRCGVSADSLAGCSIPARQFPIGSGPKPTDEERLRLVQWIEDGAAD
tara:strand:+ start:46081 stop:46542 length:462 start_codon:yes stop_codon:yes gene_type:complete